MGVWAVISHGDGISFARHRERLKKHLSISIKPKNLNVMDKKNARTYSADL